MTRSSSVTVPIGKWLQLSLYFIFSVLPIPSHSCLSVILHTQIYMLRYVAILPVFKQIGDAFGLYVRNLYSSTFSHNYCIICCLQCDVILISLANGYFYTCKETICFQCNSWLFSATSCFSVISVSLCHKQWCFVSAPHTEFGYSM